MATWREMLSEEREAIGDKSPIIAYAPHEAAFDVEFNEGYGGSEGPAVLAWSERYVFFPVVYDGAEWLSSAPRDPTEAGQLHVGGQ